MADFTEVRLGGVLTGYRRTLGERDEFYAPDAPLIVDWLGAGNTPDPYVPPELPPDPILDGLDLINSMASVIDFGADSAMAEFVAVFQAQTDLIRIMRGG